MTDSPPSSSHARIDNDVEVIQHVDEFEALARAVLPESTYGYVAGAAGLESTMRRNSEALAELLLVPKVLSGVDKISMTASVLGVTAALPLLVAPSAMQKLAHPDGEVATARAAAAAGIPMVLSMNASISVEEVAATGADLMMQLYVSPDRSPVKDVIDRAEAAGAHALFLTVDHAGMPVRLRELRQPLVIPDGISFAHLSTDPAKRGVDGTLSWDDVEWLRSVSKLPIVLKGVLHPDDVRLAVEHGVDAVVVSNHGGRQLDSVVSPYDMIEPIVEAADGRTTIIVDGGVRSGTDLIKILALGAHAAMVGRPIWWALAAAGELGVARVLELLRRDFEAALRLCGLAHPQAATTDLLFRKGSR